MGNISTQYVNRKHIPFLQTFLSLENRNQLPANVLPKKTLLEKSAEVCKSLQTMQTSIVESLHSLIGRTEKVTTQEHRQNRQKHVVFAKKSGAIMTLSHNLSITYANRISSFLRTSSQIREESVFSLQPELLGEKVFFHIVILTFQRIIT